MPNRLVQKLTDAHRSSLEKRTLRLYSSTADQAIEQVRIYLRQWQELSDMSCVDYERTVQIKLAALGVSPGLGAHGIGFGIGFGGIGMQGDQGDLGERGDHGGRPPRGLGLGSGSYGVGMGVGLAAAASLPLLLDQSTAAKLVGLKDSLSRIKRESAVLRKDTTAACQQLRADEEALLADISERRDMAKTKIAQRLRPLPRSRHEKETLRNLQHAVGMKTFD